MRLGLTFNTRRDDGRVGHPERHTVGVGEAHRCSGSSSLSTRSDQVELVSRGDRGSLLTQERTLIGDPGDVSRPTEDHHRSEAAPVLSQEVRDHRVGQSIGRTAPDLLPIDNVVFLDVRVVHRNEEEVALVLRTCKGVQSPCTVIPEPVIKRGQGSRNPASKPITIPTSVRGDSSSTRDVLLIQT